MRVSFTLSAFVLVALVDKNAHGWVVDSSFGSRKIFTGARRIRRTLSPLPDTISSPPMPESDPPEATLLKFEEPTLQPAHEVEPEQTEEAGISAATATQSVEEQLKSKLVQEADARQIRKLQVKSLTSQLNRSMARKQEVEDLIAQELSILRSKLEQDLSTEVKSKVEMQELLRSFNDAVTSKTKFIESEEKVYQQLSGIRLQVVEENIAKQLDIPIGKKSELIAIEKGLLLELISACKDLEAEINDTSERIASMSEVLARLPDTSDVNQMRAYSWFEIQALQGVILEKLTASEQRDERVAELLNKFDDALVQRSTVLEEPVATRASFDPRANTAMILRSDADVWDATTRASKSLVLALGAAASSALSAVQQFLTSEAKISTQESLVTAAASLKNASASTRSLADVARKAWMDGMGNPEDIDNTEKLLVRIAAAVSNVTSSQELRKTGAKVGENTKRAFTEAVRAGGTVSSSLGQKLSSDATWEQSLKQAGSSLKTLGAALVVTLNRQFSRLVTTDDPSN